MNPRHTHDKFVCAYFAMSTFSTANCRPPAHQDYITGLPPELLVKTARLLDHRSLVNFATANRSIFGVCEPTLGTTMCWDSYDHAYSILEAICEARKLSKRSKRSKSDAQVASDKYDKIKSLDLYFWLDRFHPNHQGLLNKVKETSCLMPSLRNISSYQLFKDSTPAARLTSSASSASGMAAIELGTTLALRSTMVTTVLWLMMPNQKLTLEIDNPFGIHETELTRKSVVARTKSGRLKSVTLSKQHSHVQWSKFVRGAWRGWQDQGPRPVCEEAKVSRMLALATKYIPHFAITVDAYGRGSRSHLSLMGATDKTIESLKQGLFFSDSAGNGPQTLELLVEKPTHDCYLCDPGVRVLSELT